MKNLGKVWFKPAAGVLGLALLLVAAVALDGQQPDPASPAAPADPTARAIRLSYVEGQVQLSQGNTILAERAIANTPIFEGSRITTAEDGRAEIQFEDGSVVRIPPNSSLTLSVLRQRDAVGEAELTLSSGLGYFELQGDTASSVIRVNFGGSIVTTTGFTVVRINLDNPPGEVAVFSGNAHLERVNALSLDLHGGESIALSASEPSHYNLAETIEPDSWDAWNSDRDQLLTSQEAARTAATNSFINNNNPAWGDLDANGNWYNVPGQGYVWSPYVASGADWEPYGCGNWVWTPRYGYVWVPCESWGYLPYSSGYWDYYDGYGWGWAPGIWYPWWCKGRWGTNVGNRSAHFQPPHRPYPHPVRIASEPVKGGMYLPHPVVAVNRIPARPTANPVHVGSGPVTIAGSVVQPLKPLAPRATYGNGYMSSGAGMYRPPLTYPGTAIGGRTTYGPGSYSGYSGRPSAGTGPSAWGGYGSHGYLAGQTTYGSYSGSYSGAPVSHPSSGAAGSGHISGGGAIGGGGGGHVGGGGAVGGGGGGHVGGGGGGGASGGGAHR